MGVTARIQCTDCCLDGPEVGDCGVIGYPSAEDTPQSYGRKPGKGIASFAYIYEGFRAIGVQTWELEATLAFVRAHASHRMGLYYEGEEYVVHGRPPVSYSRSTESSRFEGDGFVHGFYEVACPQCRETFREAWPTRYRPIDGFVLDRAAVRCFQQRVRLVDSGSFHRVAGVLDPGGGQEQLALFLERHGRHAPVARTVDEEVWTEHVDQAPRLRQVWQYGSELHFQRGPVVDADRVYVAGMKGLACLDHQGRVVWTRPGNYQAGPCGPMCLTDGGLAVVTYQGPDLKAAQPYTIEMLDRATGAVRWSSASRFCPVLWIPEAGAFLGREARFEPEAYDTLAWVSLDAALATTWEKTRRPVAAQRFGGVAAFGADRLFTMAHGSLVALHRSTGDQLWERPLAPFGRSWADHATCLAAVGDRVVLSLLGSTVGFDVNDGEPVWKITGEGASGPWGVYEGTLYAPGKVFRAVDVASGTVIVEGPGVPKSTPPPLAPTFRGTPAVTEKHVFIGDSPAGRIWAFDRDTLTPIYMYRPPGGTLGERMVSAGGRLYVQAGSLRCIG